VGNAFAATADNPSAIYYNPAGITQLEGNNLQIGSLVYFGINAEYQPPNNPNTTVKSSDAFVYVPSIYYTLSPKNQSFAIGLGIYAPFGLSTEWPQDSGFRTLAIQGKLTYMTLNPVIAWRILPNLSLAGGATINYSELDLQSGIALPVPNSDSFHFNGSGWSYGFNAGLRWQISDKWAIGGQYRSAVTADYEGDTSTYFPLPAIPSGTTQSTTSLDFPQIASGGISFRPNKHWNIEANADWTDWHSMQQIVLQDTPLGNVTIPMNWRSSWFYEGGVSYTFDSGIRIGAGYFYSQSSTTDSSFNPLVPDTNLHVGSIGVSYRGEHWRFGIAGQIITGPWRNVSDSQPWNPLSNQSANGSYQLFVPAVTAAVGYHF
jgi:long-chain fatty acid transport protein